MKRRTLIIWTLVLSLNVAFSQENTETNNPQISASSYLELPRIEVIPITESKNGRPYELYIKLPESYADSVNKRYPVIYYTDAMWHVEMLSGSTEYIMPEVILVGISWQKGLTLDVGPHVSRFRDYSIRESSNPEHQAKYQFGQASNHLDFIRNDVITYIEKEYRTDPKRRTYFGYSLGGEFGAYVLTQKSDTFKNYILGSPSLRGEVPYLTEAVTALEGKDLNANVFISYGSLEKELGKHANDFIALLQNRNDESLSLTHVVIEGSHQTAFPMTAVRSVTWMIDSVTK